MVNVLTDIRSFKKVEVPMIPGAWVEFYDDILMGTFEQAQQAQKTQDLKEAIEFTLVQIHDWNFANAEEKKLPINYDTIKKLPIKIVGFLVKGAKEALTFTQEEEKKSTSTSVDSLPNGDEENTTA